MTKLITEDIYWVGADEHRQPLFENIHRVTEGVSYNSYLLLDEKTVLFDTVDWSVARQFLDNIQDVLNGRDLDYLVVNHMEPDHCACIEAILVKYPNAKIITTQKAYAFMGQFGYNVEGKVEIVGENDTKNFGKHTIKFILAPLVHWPETMVSYDETSKILFSSDAFGTFGALNGKLFYDEYENKIALLDEYRRYYTNIVGKYGPQVQSLLKKTSALDISMICPLHGPILRNDLAFFIEKYNLWSSYKPEENGVLVVYSSMYGNTESATKSFALKLQEIGVSNVEVFDVSNTEMSKLISLSFKYSHIVFGAVTYNAGLFPLLHNYVADMKALNLQNKTIGIIENGTWACTAGKNLKDIFATMKNMTILENIVTIKSALKDENLSQINALAEEIKNSMN